MKKIITLTVNDIKHELAIEPRWTLLQLLREELGLTGTKKGCGIGDCGCCTVLVNDVATLSCLTLAIQVDGCCIETVGCPDGSSVLERSEIQTSLSWSCDSKGNVWSL